MREVTARHVRVWIVVILLICLFLFPILINFKPPLLSFAIEGLILIQLTLAWSILAYGGMISFGTAAFFGFGAYATVLAEIHFENVLIGLFVGLALTAAFSFATSIVTSRLTGMYFALSTLALTELLHGLVDYLPANLAGGPGGILSGITTTSLVDIFYYGAVMFSLTLGVGLYITRFSRFRIIFTAMRNDETLSRSLGVNTFWPRSFLFALYGFIAGSVGAYYVHFLGILTPADVFGLQYNLYPLVTGLLGGATGVANPVVVSTVVYLVYYFLVGARFPQYSNYFYAFLLLIVVYAVPPVRNRVLSYVRRGARA